MLESAVSRRFDWRIMSNRNDQPRFVIDRRVRYDLLRGWTVYAHLHIVGSFQKSPSGATLLRYNISGSGVPLYHAVLNVVLLLVFALLLGSLVSSITVPNRWIGIVLVGVLLMAAAAVSWFAYRSYRSQMQELNGFMVDFARRMGAQTVE